jgi:hypothetical protein
MCFRAVSMTLAVKIHIVIAIVSCQSLNPLFLHLFQVIYSRNEIFFLAQEVYDTLEQEETDLLIWVHDKLQERQH